MDHQNCTEIRCWEFETVVNIYVHNSNFNGVTKNCLEISKIFLSQNSNDASIPALLANSSPEIDKAEN